MQALTDYIAILDLPYLLPPEQIVGAGAAGVGCGVILQQLGVTKLKIVERYDVGASFARWPKEMHFITPSFPSNGFGLLDLNAVTLHTSPAYSLKTEHPDGAAYARYLQAVAEYHQLPLATGINVSFVRSDPHREGSSSRLLKSGLLELVVNKHIVRIECTAGGYVAEAESGERDLTPTCPLLAMGFVGSLQCIANRFEWNEKKQAVLTAEDESTIAPGLFVVGPSVRQNNLIFCFIYKFRQRFAVVANAIAQRLGLDTTPLEAYRTNGMFLDDLTCCGDGCEC